MKPPEITLRPFVFAASSQVLASSLLAVLLTVVPPLRLEAQDIKRAEATRAELQASLAELDQYAASSGYSGRLRGEKRREADMIRARLEDGDLHVGDQIDLAVVGQVGMTGLFSVISGRVLSLPGLPEIPVKGVLRSEAKDYLTAQIGKYIRDPQVRVSTMIRLSVFGSVGNPGFYQVAADKLASDAIMAAGGPAGNADATKSVIRRGGLEIWSKEAFREAIQKGLTLDQLNLRAGDELVVDPAARPSRISVPAVLGVVGSLTTLLYLFDRLRIF